MIKKLTLKNSWYFDLPDVFFLNALKKDPVKFAGSNTAKLREALNSHKKWAGNWEGQVT